MLFNMKSFPMIFAIIALLWAILSPLLLPVLDAADGIRPMTRLVNQMSKSLRSALPKEDPSSETAIVSLPAQTIYNSAGALDWAGESIHFGAKLRTVYSAISSVTIIIMSLCILTNRRKTQNPQ